MELTKKEIDLQIVERFLKASTEREKQSAFNDIYKKYFNGVTHFIGKFIRNVDDKEDLVMTTFSKVYNNISNYDKKEGAFSTWIYKIAKNASIDLLRKDNFEVISFDSLTSKTEEGEYEFQVKGDFYNPEEIIIKEENKKKVHDAIDSMENQNIKRIMTLRFIQQLSYEEIAQLEKVPVGISSLRISVKRGKKILKEKLGEY